MTLLRLMVRRHRLETLSWCALLIALSGASVSAYQSTYATAEQRRIGVELAQHDAATTLMYGHLADPGTSALMFTWEIGAISTILAAVMAILIAVTLTRAAEDNGTLEIIRSCGISPRIPVFSALLMLGGIAVVLALGCTLSLGTAGAHVDGVDWTGAATYGAVVALTFLLFGALAVGLAQVAATAGQARLLGFAAVGVAFAVRVFADTNDAGWMNWFTPLGLRATVQPFAGDHWMPLVAGLVVAILLAYFAVVLVGHREFGAGLVRRSDSSDNRLRVHTVAGLTLRLTRSSLLAWTVAVSAITTLFCAMGAGTVQQRDLGGFLGAQIGGADPVAGYLSYCGTVTGMIVSVFGILGMLIAARDESTGLSDLTLTTGRRRWTPLGARAAVVTVESALILATAGGLSALVAPRVIDGAGVASRTLTYVFGQLPAVVALIGITTLLVGLRPRWGGLAWLALAASALFVMLGHLLGIPDRVLRLGVFEHVPDVAATQRGALALVVLLVVGVSAGAIGLLGVTRRDIVNG